MKHPRNAFSLSGSQIAQLDAVAATLRFGDRAKFLHDVVTWLELQTDQEVTDIDVEKAVAAVIGIVPIDGDCNRKTRRQPNEPTTTTLRRR
jgi:hypothetical protein